MNPSRILIYGATSGIAQSIARLYAKRNTSLHLVGRNEERLKSVAQDLIVQGAAKAEFSVADLDLTDSHYALVQRNFKSLGIPDVILIAYGNLGDEKEAQKNYSYARSIFQTNFLSTVSLLTCLAERLEPEKKGTIAVISSVAGDRGRQSNYVYGASKGALNVFLSGLRQRLFRSGIHVLTLKPGFVDTPMTRSFKKGPLWVQPAAIAPRIVRAIDHKRDVTYVPRFWFLIMWVIRSIPEQIFKRLKL